MDKLSECDLSNNDNEKDVQISQLDVDENQNIDDYKKKSMNKLKKSRRNWSRNTSSIRPLMKKPSKSIMKTG